MNAAEIADALSAKSPGQVYGVTVTRAGHTRAGCPLNITKESRLQGQMCDYANRAPIAAALADGTREPLELPKHIEESFTIGNVRFWRGRNGKIYLPVVLFGSNIKAQWFVDGKPVEKDSIAQYLLASETRAHTESAEGTVPFIAVDVTNVTAIR